MNEGLLSVKNASGRQVSLLNNNEEGHKISEDWQHDSQQSKRKYHCIEPGCNKSFTTSGHLARHNRIHTGEKNFPCLFPGCQSRFSRQDNMMQHYRTHMSPKSKRSQKRGPVDEDRPKPRLHAHHRIKSDPIRVEPPLTIDQHLSNYHQSLNKQHYSPVKFDLINSHLIKKKSDYSHHGSRTPTPSTPTNAITPTTPTLISTTTTTISTTTTTTTTISPSSGMFYQHRPLTFNHKPNNEQFPYTLLHPTQKQEELLNVPQNHQSGNSSPDDGDQDKNDPMDQDSNKSTKDGLLQLAHIVSTFG